MSDLRSTPAARGRSPNLLVVDDDESDVHNLRTAIERSGLAPSITVANDGVEALRMLRADLVPEFRRLVLLDLEMPRMSGLEFLRALRADARLRRVPVVVVTRSSDERDQREAYELHVAGYLLEARVDDAFADNLATLVRYWSVMEM